MEDVLYMQFVFSDMFQEGSPVLGVLPELLIDRTTGKNIIWATETYEKYGAYYHKECQMFPDFNLNLLLDGILLPRVYTSREQQAIRTKTKAEVFTPSYICNRMINLCDEVLFNRKNVFNIESSINTWESVEGIIFFNDETVKKQSAWKRYIDTNFIEITCGEAPFLVSRYDTTTGESLHISDRIGVIDRKMRVVNENTNDAEEWLYWAYRAFESSYGYEYQGDNVFFARLNLLATFIDYYMDKFGNIPCKSIVKRVATIISWNIWQMNGLTDTPPNNENLFCKIKKWTGHKIVEFHNVKGARRKMFDFCIGNPPYQDENRRQLYPGFFIAGQEIAKCVDMIFPTGWQDPKTGNNLKVMNTEEVKKDSQIVLIDNVHNVFNGVKGAEWTNIIIWKKGFKNGHNGKQMVMTNGENPEVKELATKWVMLSELEEILKKVNEHNPDRISDIIHLQTKLNLTRIYTDYPECVNFIGSEGKDKRIITNSFDVLPIFSEQKSSVHDIMVYGTSRRNRITRYVNDKYLTDENGAIKKYKVLLPAAGQGVVCEGEKVSILGKPFIAKPKEGFSQSFIGFGIFESEKEANCCLKYIKTKFFRIMVGTLKKTQHNHADVFKNVPIQDFTQFSDIDWSKPIADIDKALYKKYGLTDDQEEFIESHIKEMI